MNTWGIQNNGEEWKFAITNLLNKSKVYALLPITNESVVTSGNYEKQTTFNVKPYTYTIDPRTGYLSSGIISVRVFAPKVELADALMISIFVMGKDVGLNKINQLPNIECVIIDEKGNLFTSSNIEIIKI